MGREAAGIFRRHGASVCFKASSPQEIRLGGQLGAGAAVRPWALVGLGRQMLSCVKPTRERTAANSSTQRSQAKHRCPRLAIASPFARYRRRNAGTDRLSIAAAFLLTWMDTEALGKGTGSALVAVATMQGTRLALHNAVAVAVAVAIAHGLGRYDMAHRPPIMAIGPHAASSRPLLGLCSAACLPVCTHPLTTQPRESRALGGRMCLRCAVRRPSSRPAKQLPTSKTPPVRPKTSSPLWSLRRPAFLCSASTPRPLTVARPTPARQIASL